jgi:hypothetical protein
MQAHQLENNGSPHRPSRLPLFENAKKGTSASHRGADRSRRRERLTGFTVTAVFKEHFAKGGFEVLTVMVDEAEAVPDAGAEAVSDNL